MAESKLKHAMLDAHIKVPELAKVVGVHQSNMYAIVNGGSIPHLRTAQMIVKVLNERGVKVTINELWPLPDEKEGGNATNHN